mgnify:CR=1 FL=1
MPKCDGSNGIFGLDCSSVRGYPKKTAGRPWGGFTDGRQLGGKGEMNDAYPHDHPLEYYYPTNPNTQFYPSRGVVGGDKKKEALAQVEGDEKLPKCDGSNGIFGLDCSSVRGYPKKTDGRPWGGFTDGRQLNLSLIHI